MHIQSVWFHSLFRRRLIRHLLALDVGQQSQQVSNSARVFAINPAARSRLNAVQILALFIGQVMGTSESSAGNRIAAWTDHHSSQSRARMCTSVTDGALLAVLTSSG